MKSRPIFLRTLRLRKVPHRSVLSPPHFPLIPLRSLSTTCRLLADKPPEAERPPEPGNAPPQSPWKVFTSVLKEEIEKNQAWQQNVKELRGDVDKMADTAALKRAREMYEKSRITNLIKENPRLRSAAAQLSRAGISVSDAASRALQDSGVIEAIGKVSNTYMRFTQPVRDTETYKMISTSLEDAFDEMGLQGYEEKDERRRKREKRAEKAGLKTKRVKADPTAGEALVVSNDQPGTSRSSFLKSSAAYQRFMENYYESDAPIYSALRSVGSRLSGWFDENDMAKVIRAMRELDPDFGMDSFQRELREYIVPEVVDAYLSADREGLKNWMGEACFNVCWATIGEYVKQGLVSDSRILDIAYIDIAKGAFVNETLPAFIVTFQTQELLLFRSALNGEAMVGSENTVDMCRYAIVVTRVEEGLENELTGGWKVIELVRRKM